MVGGPVVAKFMRNQVGTTVEVPKFLIQAIRIGGANHPQVRNADHAAIQLFSGEEVGNITLDELLVGVPPRPELRKQTRRIGDAAIRIVGRRGSNQEVRQVMGNPDFGFILQVHGVEHRLNPTEGICPPSLEESPIGLGGQTTHLQSPASSRAPHPRDHRIAAVVEHPIDHPTGPPTSQGIRRVVHRCAITPRFKHP